jgi:hypothetical protein
VDFELFFRAPGTGVLRLEGARRETRLFTTGRPSATLFLGPDSGGGRTGWSWRGLRSGIRIGVAHIWSRADHMLFLLALQTSVVTLLRDTRFYRRWILEVGSLVIAIIALVWMVQRLVP